MIIGVDLGVGMRKQPDSNFEKWYGVDIRKFKAVDYVLDVGKDKLPFDDDSVDIIRSIHLFEHLYSKEFFHAMNECFRIIKPDGVLHIEVPKAGTQAFYIHPDHKLQFTEDTFGFFSVPDNEGHIDPHGYLDGFWYIEILPHDNPETVELNMYPNKKGNSKFPYVKVRRQEDE